MAVDFQRINLAVIFPNWSCSDVQRNRKYPVCSPERVETNRCWETTVTVPSTVSSEGSSASEHIQALAMHPACAVLNCDNSVGVGFSLGSEADVSPLQVFHFNHVNSQLPQVSMSKP